LATSAITKKEIVMKTPNTPGPRGRTDDGKAFLPDPYEPNTRDRAVVRDSLAEGLAEEFISSATSGEEVSQENRDAPNLEEVGGPFVETSAQEEFAGTVDETNPADGERAPFPTTSSES
jgi:hypothetical protein